MKKPPWTVSERRYVSVEALLGLIPVLGSSLQSALKLILRIQGEARFTSMTQEEYDALEYKDKDT